MVPSFGPYTSTAFCHGGAPTEEGFKRVCADVAWAIQGRRQDLLGWVRALDA